MYTQCPECNQYHLITAKILRADHGFFFCKTCEIKVDALTLLHQGTIPRSTPLISEGLAFKTAPVQQPSAVWKIAAVISVVTLLVQVYYFEGFNLTQQSRFRPWLEKSCNTLNCQLPLYQNLAEISILNGSFDVETEKSYRFNVALINQSDFTQRLPSIKLSLQNYTGQTFATRIFHPNDYVTNADHLIHPNRPTEITLSIATPASHIGGYHFELI